MVKRLENIMSLGKWKTRFYAMEGAALTAQPHNKEVFLKAMRQAARKVALLERKAFGLNVGGE